MTKPTVLILCAGNSCRSHLAEGILNAPAGDLLDVQSAGSNPAGYVNPLAVKVMTEIGVDISGHRSKHFEKLEVFRRVRDEIRRVFEAYAAGRIDQTKGKHA